MTLNKKIEKIVDNPFTIDDLEKIADDYAIEFAGWMHDNCYYNSYYLYKMYRNGEEQFELEQLLEIFKKEKGL